MPVRLLLTGAFLLLVSSYLLAHAGHKEKSETKPQILAPGYQTLSFKAPSAGSYSLPALGTAADGKILNMQGQTSNLNDYLGDKYVVLSFIYTQCDDVNGCPLATYVSSQVQNSLIDDSTLNNEVRFISFSFDPVNDTPAVLRKYAENFIKQGFDWQFVTTASEIELNPILEKYSQSILRDVDESGNAVGTISHILRVFLIDTEKQIRNIYSTSFLHADTIVNDIKTLILESTTPPSIKHKEIRNLHKLHGAGDNKENYAYLSYETRTKSLDSRLGKSADLFNNIKNTPMGLPAVDSAILDKITREKIQLGRQLFYDRRLSHNNTFSCAMCHIAEQGFTSHELATAIGFEGRTVRRNAPTLYNIAYAQRLFHDARENMLEQQIWGPLLARNEMANPSVGRVIEKVKAISDYRDKFSSIYKGESVNISNLGDAIASYERSLISANSNFDRWYFGKVKNALSKKAQAGYRLFAGKAGCTTCHTIEKNFALFTDQKLHNTGIGYLHSMQKSPARRDVLVAPGTWLKIDAKVIKDSSEPRLNDLGYYEITNDPDDRWKYKTPSLRNIALTAPYMHDGSLSSLGDVVKFYNTGGIRNELLDPLLQPLNLSPNEIEQVVAFLNNLNGDNIDLLIGDAFAAPVGNTQ